jgi:hypothetical protein
MFLVYIEHESIKIKNRCVSYSWPNPAQEIQILDSLSCFNKITFIDKNRNTNNNDNSERISKMKRMHK